MGYFFGKYISVSGGITEWDNGRYYDPFDIQQIANQLMKTVDWPHRGR